MAATIRAMAHRVPRLASALSEDAKRKSKAWSAINGYSLREGIAQIMEDCATANGIPTGYPCEDRFAAAACLKRMKSIDLLEQAIDQAFAHQFSQAA
jgi:hypothetical protein